MIQELRILTSNTLKHSLDFELCRKIAEDVRQSVAYDIAAIFVAREAHFWRKIHRDRSHWR